MRTYIKFGFLIAALLIAPLLATALGGGQNAPADQAAPARSPSTSSLYDKPMQRLNLTVFAGRIVTDGAGKYYLKDGSTNVSYLLDNPKLAAHYEGKAVDIEGHLIPPGNILHVNKIEAFH